MEDTPHKMTIEKFETTCTDSVVLKGTLYIPAHPKAVVQFNGGTATKKEFYEPFVEYLAQHGYLCCLWDYRGSGESAPEDLKSCEYTFSDYGIKDMPAIKNFLTNRYPALPFLIFGHSVGGQQVGFMNNLDGVKGMVNFAVSTGYIYYMPLSYKLTTMYFFFIFTPLSLLFTGFLSSKKFGIMENLPKNVITEWKAWCLKRDYLFDRKILGNSVPNGNFQKFQFPIHTFWAEDDTISNERNTQTYWSHIKSTEPITFTKLIPSEYGVKAMGHFGFFKRRMKDKLWMKAIEKLDAMLC